MVEVDGERVKAWEFLLRLMYSGREFAWLYERCDQLAFLEATCGPSLIWAGSRGAAYTKFAAAVRKIVGARANFGRFLAS